MDSNEILGRIEACLRENARKMDAAAGYYTSPTAMTTRLFVRDNARNRIDITVVSPLFEGLEDDERDQVLFDMGQGLSDEDVSRIVSWNLLTLNEAKTSFPETLRQMDASETLGLVA